MQTTASRVKRSPHEKHIGLGRRRRSGYVFAVFEEGVDQQLGARGYSQMTNRVKTWLVSGVATVLACGWAGMVTTLGQQAPQYAGAVERGFLLPDGWTLSPAGRQVTLPDLPLNIL